MEQKYLIDTNIIIYFLGNLFEEKERKFVLEIIKNGPIISAITKIELLGTRQSKQTESAVSSFLKHCTIISISDDIIDKTIEIKKQLSIKTPDAIIGAISIMYKKILVTLNTKDFKNINQLQQINPCQTK